MYASLSSTYVDASLGSTRKTENDRDRVLLLTVDYFTKWGGWWTLNVTLAVTTTPSSFLFALQKYNDKESFLKC